ncbi:MAG: hypothetical protein GY829_12875 [Gammaproteobacteria bacterium]|nr:hypothetical protein [Gammaproteobacteria bacterium]
MFKGHKNWSWLLINFILYTLSAVIALIAGCYSGSNCIIENNTTLLDIVLAPLVLVTCWVFTWGLVCTTFGLVHVDKDNLMGVTAWLSYVAAIICGSIFPIMLVGG